MPHTSQRRQPKRVTFAPLNISFPEPIQLSSRPRSSLQSLLDMIRRAEQTRATQIGNQAIAASAQAQLAKNAQRASFSTPRPIVTSSLTGPIEFVEPPKRDGGLLPTLNLPGLSKLPFSGTNLLNKAIDLIPGPNINIGKSALAGVTAVEQVGGALSQLLAVDPNSLAPQDLLLRTITGGIPGLQQPFEKSTSEAVRGTVARVVSGDTGLKEGFEDLRTIQESRGTLSQILSETTGPLGLLELVPVGLPAKFGRTTKTIAESVRAAQKAKRVGLLSVVDEVGEPIRTFAVDQFGETRIITNESSRIFTLPESQATFDQLLGKQPVIFTDRALQPLADQIPDPLFSILPETVQAGLSGALPKPILEMAKVPYRIFNPIALMNRDDPLSQWTVLIRRMDKLVPEVASLQTQRMNALGDVTKIFDLEDGLHTTNSDLGFGRTFNAIFENFTDLTSINKTTPEQQRWVRGFGEMVEEMNAYLIKQGIPRDALFKGNVDEYFPRIYAMFNDIELRRGGGGSIGSVPFYEHYRTYGPIEDAIGAGFIPATPMESIQLMVQSMYKQVADKQVLDLMRPYGFTIKNRMHPEIVETLTRSKQKLSGMKKVSEIVRILSSPGLQSRAPRAGARFAGRAEAERVAPELMQRLDEISDIALIADRRVAFKALRSQIAQELDKARKSAQVARLEATLARKQARGVTFMGEVQFPGTGMGGRIITPDDLADFVNPEGAIRDFKTLPRADIKRLQKLMGRPARTTIDGILTAAQQGSAALRTLETGFDGGSWMIHLLPVLFNQPAIWAKSMQTSLKMATNPVAMGKFVDDHAETIQKLINFDQFHGAGSEYVESLRKGGLLRGAAEKIPGLPGRAAIRTMEGFEGQFNGSLIAAKTYLWEAMEPMARNPGELEELASHIAKMTGTMSMANMGITPTTQKVLGGLLLFAPRYRMAVYGLMTDVFRGGMKGELARESLGKMMFGGLLMYSIMAQRAGQPMNLDPRSGKFLTLKIGDANIGLGSAFVSVARFTAGVAEQSYSNPTAFAKIWDSDNVLNRFVRGQLAPAVGTAWDLVSGRNFMGKPTTASFPDFFSNVVTDRLLPFWISGLMDYPFPGWFSAPADFFGARSYGVSLNERALTVANQAATLKHSQQFYDLNQDQRNRLLRDNPEIQKMFDESTKFWGSLETDGLVMEGRRVTGTRVNEYREILDGAFREYNFKINESAEFFERALHSDNPNRFNGEDMRAALQSEGARIGNAFEQLRRKIEDGGLGYGDVAEALELVGAHPDAQVEDIAYLEYLQKIIHGDFDVIDSQTGEFTGEYDFRAREQTIAVFEAKWGAAAVKYVEDRRAGAKELPTVVQELEQGRPFLRGYWNVGEDIILGMGWDDLLPKWRDYQGAHAERQSEIKKEFPRIREVVTTVTRSRAQYRAEHQDADAFLRRWYPNSGLLKHEFNLAQDIDVLIGTPVYLGVGNVP